MTTPPPLPPAAPNDPAAAVPFATPVARPPGPMYGHYAGNPYGIPAPPPPYWPPPPAPAGEKPKFGIHWASLLAMVPFALVMFLAASRRAAENGADDDARTLGYQTGAILWPLVVAAFLAWVAFVICGRPRRLATVVFIAVYVLFAVPSFVRLAAGPDVAFGAGPAPAAAVAAPPVTQPPAARENPPVAPPFRRPGKGGIQLTPSPPAQPPPEPGAQKKPQRGPQTAPPVQRRNESLSAEGMKAEATLEVMSSLSDSRAAIAYFKQVGGLNMANVEAYSQVGQRVGSCDLLLATLRRTEATLGGAKGRLQTRLAQSGLSAADAEAAAEAWAADLGLEKDREVVAACERAFVAVRAQLCFLRDNWGKWKYDTRLQGCKFQTLQLLEEFNRHVASFNAAQKAMNDAISRNGGTRLQPQ